MSAPSPARWPVVASLLAVATALLTALLCLVWSNINYDEAVHAHALWLVSEGERPFHDFVAMHLPWCWYLLRPVAVVLEFDPTARWIGLRLVGFVPILLAIAVVVVPGSVAGRTFRLLVGALVLSSPPVCAVATEFRPDSWSYPLLLLGGAVLVSSRVGGVEGVARAGFGAFVVVMGLAFTPKWIVFSPALVVAMFALDREARRQARGAVIGMAGGIVAALLVLGAILTLADVDAGAVWTSTMGFQWQFQRSFPGGGAFALALVREPVFLLAVVAVVVRLVGWRRGGRGPGALDVAAVAVLGWSVVTIPFAYKQYVGPALLLAAVLIVGLEDVVLAVRPARSRRLALGAVIALAVVIALASASLATLTGSSRESTERLERGVLVIVDERLPVAMGQPGHPLSRRDSLRGTVCAFNPAGPDSGAIMSELDLPAPLTRSTTTAGILEELEASPPAVLSLRGFWCPFQKEALQAFLDAHRSDYAEVRKGIFARPAVVDVERLGALLAPPGP